MMNLKDISKAFGCNVSMLANTMGYTRQGLHTALKTGEVQKTRMYGSLKHLEAISQLQYEEELIRAKERKQDRENGIKDMAYLFNLCWEPDKSFRENLEFRRTKPGRRTMKIGELQERCGECPLIDYCTGPYETPKLCAIEVLHDVSTDTYRELAEKVTATEMQEKLRQYEKCGVGWTDESMGTICDIVLEKLHQIKI